MKAQRIRITEAGWGTFNGNLCGVEFVNGLSVDLVPHAAAQVLGTLFGVEGVDDGAQVGMGADLQRGKKTKATVEAPQPAVQAPKAATEPTERYTREDLEAVADRDGIAGLRAVADKFKVKGRGIAELITEILRAQG